MTDVPYRVFIVLDPDFGERLAHLPPGEPVWVVNSPANSPVARRLQSERAGATHLTGVTTFDGCDDRERCLLDMLDTIDLHHGRYSADPPYSIAEVFGLAPSAAVRRSFVDLGLTQFEVTQRGFVASRDDVAPAACGSP